MTTKENIKAVLACNFSGFKDEIIESAANRIMELVDNAPTVKQQKVVTIPHELIEKLVLCAVDIVENIDWDKALEAYKARPHGKWIM